MDSNDVTEAAAAAVLEQYDIKPEEGESALEAFSYALGGDVMPYEDALRSLVAVARSL